MKNFGKNFFFAYYIFFFFFVNFKKEDKEYIWLKII